MEKFQPHYIREACHELPEMQLSAANDNNSVEWKGAFAVDVIFFRNEP